MMLVFTYRSNSVLFKFSVSTDVYIHSRDHCMTIAICICDTHTSYVTYHPYFLTFFQADGTFPAKNRIIQDGGNLTIVNLGKEDHGSYECVATNLVTSVITTTLLIIECKYLSQQQ